VKLLWVLFALPSLVFPAWESASVFANGVPLSAKPNRAGGAVLAALGRVEGVADLPEPPTVNGKPVFESSEKQSQDFGWLRGFMDAHKIRKKDIDVFFNRGIAEIVFTQSKGQKADPLLVLAVIMQESRFHVRDKSYAGARGLMQIMPRTGAKLGLSRRNNFQDFYDPIKNIRAGIAYLKEQFQKFSKTPLAELASIDPMGRRDVEDAIAAYNGGPGAVPKYRQDPDHEQTRKYVPKVLGYYLELRYRSKHAR
jgi:hypothetical protein